MEIMQLFGVEGSNFSRQMEAKTHVETLLAQDANAFSRYLEKELMLPHLWVRT